MRTAATHHSIDNRPQWVLWGVLFGVMLAELLTSLVDPQVGLVAHAALLVGLTLYGALGRLDAARKLALALTLAPLIRLLSLALPLARFPQVAWYPMVAVPLFLAAGILIRLLGISRQMLGLRVGSLPIQLMLVGGGLGLGALEYMILKPAPLLNSLAPDALWLPALSLIICTGLSEELIFRGLLQPVAMPALGRWAIAYVALLFAVLHIGYLSVLDVLFVFAVGLVFGYIVRLGGSILGVSLAHGLTNITLFLLLPYAARNPGALANAMPWAVAAGSGVAILAIYMLILRTLVQQAAVAPHMPSWGNIREQRRRAGLAYIDLAERTGISVRTLAEIEHGLRLPQPEQIQLIADALGAG